MGNIAVSANRQAETDPPESAADEAIAACGGDVRAALKALIVASERLRAAASNGYVRGGPPRDRKDWYE
jgi:hypothetical protein